AQRRNRAWKTDRDGAVEQADVDAELERARRRDAEQLAFDEPPLDLTPLGRRVTGAVRCEPCAGLLVDALDGEPVDQLGGLAALGEADRPQATRDERGEQARRFAERAGAQAELGVEQLRVPETDRALGAWSGVAVDDRCLHASERRCELTRVRDRRGSEQ